MLLAAGWGLGSMVALWLQKQCGVVVKRPMSGLGYHSSHTSFEEFSIES